MMKEEGLESIFARHQRLTNATRSAIKALGLPLLHQMELPVQQLRLLLPIGLMLNKFAPS